MSDSNNVHELEAALLNRAERLADEYIAHGRDGRQAILNDERERLRILEERATQEATGYADRLYRRRVQAAQLRLQGIVDQLRWELIRDVAENLSEPLAAVADDEASYEALLQTLLARGVASIGGDNLAVQMNARDLERYRGHWRTLCKVAAPGKKIDLDPVPLECSGGLRIATRDNSVCVDATFEGRIDRFRDDLVQTIAEHLFARETHKGS